MSIFQEDINNNLYKMNQKPHFNAAVNRIFNYFNWLIEDNFSESFTCADSEDRKENSEDRKQDFECRRKEWNDRKKLVRTMLSILREISFSTESFIELKPYYRGKTSPRTYIQIMSGLVDDIEMNFEAGIHKTFLQLQQFSQRYDGKIPTRGPHQEIILTLVNLFHFYSNHIFNFNRTSLKLDNCTPKFLALLIESSSCIPFWEEIFALFISDGIISDSRDNLYCCHISPILRKHKLEGDTHPSIVLKVFQGESPDRQWLLEAYLKLVLLDQQ